jgi:SAM-dependent methyltransferase/uncharacterized protein YbaR (Trm112 family)
MVDVPLVCPACRGPVPNGAGLQVRLLATGEPGTLACACGAMFPVVDGVPIVRRDLGAWLASEGPEALRRGDLPPALERILVEGTGGAVARNDSLVSVYSQTPAGGLQRWLLERAATFEGAILEMGSGLGVTGRRDVLAVDHNFGLLRRHRAWARVCADAADPPFLAESFDVVVLANVLDSCADPGLVLAQADALLAPGGHLVVTCAFAFQEGVTPRERWFDASALDLALRGETELGGYRIAGHTVVEHVPNLDWPLALSPRLSHVHAADAWVTRKPEPPEAA